MSLRTEPSSENIENPSATPKPLPPPSALTDNYRLMLALAIGDVGKQTQERLEKKETPAFNLPPQTTRT